MSDIFNELAAKLVGVPQRVFRGSNDGLQTLSQVVMEYRRARLAQLQSEWYERVVQPLLTKFIGEAGLPVTVEVTLTGPWFGVPVVYEEPSPDAIIEAPK